MSLKLCSKGRRMEGLAMRMECVMGEEIHELALSRMEQEALGDAQRTRLEDECLARRSAQSSWARVPPAHALGEPRSTQGLNSVKIYYH